MVSLPLYICCVIHAATLFSVAENLFSDGNDQSLSASLFTSGDAKPVDSIELTSQPANLNPANLFQLSPELADTDSFDAAPMPIEYSVDPAGSEDIFDLISDGDLQDFGDETLFSGNIVDGNDCGWDSSQIQGRIRARGSTCSDNTQVNGGSSSSSQKNRPTGEENQEPEPLAGGGVDDWDKTCENNGDENIMVCSSGNPANELNQRLPVPTDLYSLDYSSLSTCLTLLSFFCFWLLLLLF